MYTATYTLEERFWWFEGMRQIGRAFLDEHYAPGGRLKILDVGCGTGANLQLLLSRYGRPIGLDFAHEAVRLASTRASRVPVQGSADDIPFADASFDLVTAFGVMCQLGVRSDREVLDECYRVLRPGGRLLIRVPAFELLRAQHDRLGETRHRYTAPEVRTVMADSGFDVEKCTHVNTLLFPFAAAKRLSERIIPPADPWASDLRPAPLGLNGLLSAVLRAEAALVPRVSLPFGLSVMALGRKPVAAADTKQLPTRIDARDAMAHRGTPRSLAASSAGAPLPQREAVAAS